VGLQVYSNFSQICSFWQFDAPVRIKSDREHHRNSMHAKFPIVSEGFGYGSHKIQNLECIASLGKSIYFILDVQMA